MLKTAALAGVMASTAVAFAPTGPPSTRAALRPTVCGLSMEQNKQCVDLHCASRRYVAMALDIIWAMAMDHNYSFAKRAC